MKRAYQMQCGEDAMNVKYRQQSKPCEICDASHRILCKALNIFRSISRQREREKANEQARA